MALQSDVSQIDAKSVHVTLSPAMRLHTMLTLCATKGCAETLIPRLRASLRGHTVGWRLQAMLEQRRYCIAACPMPKLFLDRESLLFMNERATIIVQLLQDSIL